MWDKDSAWDVLRENYWEQGGCIYKIYQGRAVIRSREVTDIEREAINYLCTEWDYSFDFGEKI